MTWYVCSGATYYSDNFMHCDLFSQFESKGFLLLQSFAIAFQINNIPSQLKFTAFQLQTTVLIKLIPFLSGDLLQFKFAKCLYPTKER